VGCRLALALLLCAGCTDQTDLLPSDGGVDACAVPGPPIQLGESCAGALSSQLLRRAICSCSSLVLDRGLFTEGGSMGGPGGPGGPPLAAVGTDGSLQVGGPVQVAGELQASGAAGVSFARTSAVFGNLRSGGAIGSSELLTIGADAFSAGDVLGKVDVNGTLHLPAGANLTPGVAAGMVVREPVTVDPPCGCDAGPALDAIALAAAHAASNDDATIGLAPDAFAGGAGPAALDLPCGQYYLTAFAASSSVELRVHGRAALFVGGDLNADAGLHVAVDTGAELDLVIAGNLSIGNGALGGAPASSVRIWLGGKSAHLGAMATLTAAVYAPTASFTSDGDLTATGALFAHDFQPFGDLAVRFDRGILMAGTACGAMPQPPAN
jgi:hypothetical protein